MNLKILLDNFKYGLNLVEKNVAVRPQLPVLANIVLKATKEGLELQATDLEIGIKVLVRAKVLKEGEISVSGKVLTELINTLNVPTLELELTDQFLEIKSEGINTKINTIPSSEFPEMPTFDGSPDITLDSQKLLSVIQKISFTAAKDDTRPILTGILFKFQKDSLDLVTTDGYRLSVASLKPLETNKHDGSLVIPARALTELSRALERGEDNRVDIKLETEKQQVLIKTNSVTLITQLLVGEFPPYSQVIPQNKLVSLSLKKSDIIDAVKRAAIFARDSANIVKWELDTNSLTIAANNSQLGESSTTLDIKLDGEPTKIAFNSKYLLEYLSVTKDEFVFESEGPLKPAVFKEKDESLHIIMPVRVQD